MVTDQEIAKGVETLLRQSDPNSLTSLNGVVQQLESMLGLDLSHKAGFIRDQISFLLRSEPVPKDQLAPEFNPQYPNSGQSSHQFLNPHVVFRQQLHQQHNPSPPPLQPQVKPRPPPPPPLTVATTGNDAQNVVASASATPKGSTPTGTKRRGGPGGLNKVCGVSPELQAIVGEPALPRTEIVKQLCANISSHPVSNVFGSSEDMITPYVGMLFKSDHEAFEYYGNFARKNGFSIRKERSRLSPQLGVYKRDFVCYRSGFAPARKKQMGEHQRDRKSVRCGCDAKMYLSKEVVDGVSQWFVVQFSNVHNHELLEDDQVRLLPAYRKIQESDQERILLLSKAGFPVHRIVKVLELEKGIQGGQLSFLERDVRNFIQNRKKVVQENDALLTEKRENDLMDLLEACRTTKDADPYFVYDVTLDGNDKVENIAWSFGDSVNAYNMFGDVVYFETTYYSMSYGLIFGAWLGIDNHGKLVFFSCALLQDEPPRSFAWALQAFLRFMKGRHPRTIITDIDPVLREVIRSEIPNTKHFISLYNILPRASSWFSLPLGPRLTEFKREFETLSLLENTEEFDYRWNQMVSQYELNSDKHIALLFSVRMCWALSYTRGYFLARIVSSSYWKSVETFLKEVFKTGTCLRGFFEQVGVSSNSKIQTHEEAQYMHLITCLPIEEHARNILTPFAFTALQQEMVLAMQYAASEMANGSYLVCHFKKADGERLVIWIPEDEQIHCSCKEFESSGTLCRHALRVLLVKNYFQLPDKYLLNRWRQESSQICCDGKDKQNISDEWFQEFNSLTRTLFSESSQSKGRFDFVRRELTKEVNKLINWVRDVPTVDEVVMDVSVSH